MLSWSVLSISCLFIWGNGSVLHTCHDVGLLLWSTMKPTFNLHTFLWIISYCSDCKPRLSPTVWCHNNKQSRVIRVFCWCFQLGQKLSANCAMSERLSNDEQLLCLRYNAQRRCELSTHHWTGDAVASHRGWRAFSKINSWAIKPTPEVAR